MEIRKVIATASALALLAGAAFAQDFSSLLNQILSYLQQNPQVVQQVQQAVGQTAGVPSACQGVTFTRTLKLGMRGDDVQCLQALLNVSPQTGYFGPLTRSAVIKFQEDHADEILTPLGLIKGTGVVGPSTRAVLNRMISGASQAQIPIQLPTQEQLKSIWDMFVEALKKELGVSTQTPASTAGEEGTLTAEVQAVPTGVTVYEGDKNVAVMAFKVKAKDSAITIDRVDLTFNAGSAVVYKYINYAALYDGDNAIKGSDLNSSTMDKTTDSSGNAYYTVRLSGLNVKVDKDSEKVLTVKVSAVPVYPSGTLPSFTVKIAANGIRGTDTAGIQQYAPTGEISKSFNLATAETGRVEASLNSNSPKEGIQIVSEDDDTEITLAAFDLKAKKQNVTIDTVTVNVTASVTSSVKALRLYDGSTLLSEKTPSSFSAAGTTSVAFDGDMEINVAKDTTKTLTVKALIAKNTNNATYIVALASVSGTDANENSLSATPGIDGYTQYVYTVAPKLTLDSSGVNKAAKNNYEVTLNVKVTAMGGDIYVQKGANSDDWLKVATTSASQNPTLSYAVVTASGDYEEVATTGATYYKISKDKTATIGLKVTITLASTNDSGYYNVNVDTVKWDVDANVPSNDKTVPAALLKDFKVENISTAYES
jgi:peptidoglycan hydrolase-like protein with peptidoglycan-binding domain